MSDLVDHPDARDFWRHEPRTFFPCVECGEDTEWIYLDLCYLHPECDFPSPPEEEPANAEDER